MLAEQFNMEQDTETKLVGMGMAFLSRLAQQKLGHPPKPTQPGLVHKYTSSDSTLDKIAIIEGVEGWCLNLSAPFDMFLRNYPSQAQDGVQDAGCVT